jgi:dTDP-glucose 4,6-dehydratase
MKLLVTGGAGFIGSNFIRLVRELHPTYHVVNLDALTYCGNRENLRDIEGDPHYTFVHGDITDEHTVEPLVKDADAIVHFAAESHVDRSIHSPGNSVRTNILGTYILLEAARKYGVKRFHHISTDEVFGALKENDPAFHEETRYDPKSPYSATKAGSDHLVRAYGHTYGLPIIISNSSNNYGPYHFPEKFIPLTITNILEGKKAPIYGDGMQIRDWLYVEDNCRAIDAVLHRGATGHTYCVGGENQTPNVEVARAIARLLGTDDSALEFVQDRPGHDRRYAINNAKSHAHLSWRPATTLEEGLEKTIAWFKENTAWWKALKGKEFEEFYQQNYKPL